MAQEQWARLLLESLADAGVREAVISPGSRSTPFVLAAHQGGRLRLWDVIDERSAAFFALGQARVTGRPVLLICTSGTAGANYLPAVIEADAARVPLFVLTADRPVELQACGANQTIDQLKLYGGFVRQFFDLGEAQSSEGALRALRRMAAQAIFATRFPLPGPVHLNARAKKPLEPADTESAEEQELAARVERLLATPITRPRAPRLAADPDAVEELARVCAAAERGLIVAGPAPVAAVAWRAAVDQLAAATGFPLFADAASQLRFGGERPAEVRRIDSWSLLLRSAAARRRLCPELILQIGRPPTASAWERFLAEQPEVPRWVLTEDGWHDPQSAARQIVLGEIGSTVESLVGRLVDHSSRGRAWREQLATAEAAARRALAQIHDGHMLTEGGVARATVAALPAGGLLVVGNSLPIREVDASCPGDGIELLVASQRGVSGIDGVLSGAAGAAVAAGRPAALLVGDLSCLHDLSGLGLLRRLETPFALVVVQNQGGRIFEQLPLAAHPAARDGAFDHWITPHELSFGPAAELFGLGYARVERRSELETALATALARPGATLIEAVVPPHGAAEDSRQLVAKIEAGLGSWE